MTEPNKTYCETPIPPNRGYILGGRSPDPNGVSNYGFYSVGDSVLFACIAGYRMQGDPLIRCQPDGTWLGQALPSCERAPLGKPQPKKKQKKISSFLPSIPPTVTATLSLFLFIY